MIQERRVCLQRELGDRQLVKCVQRASDAAVATVVAFQLAEDVKARLSTEAVFH